MNRKRVQRLCANKACAYPPFVLSGRQGPTLSERLRASRPNQVWAIDFQFDETADRRRLKLANVVDEFAREALAIRIGRSCTADELVEVIEGLVATRGEPEHLRMDNGPEMVAWGLREWCRLSGQPGHLHRTGIALGEPLRRVLQRSPP